jgi:UDP-N-acetylmuramyl pentapeptide phosphotransferase/UDP-N-acetylglucosamine-1-phosphate transferase
MWCSDRAHPAIASAALVLGSAVLTAGFIVLLRPMLARYALARPNARSSHRVPTPQGGGIAIIAVVILGTTVIAAICPAIAATRQLLVVGGGALVLAVVGALDDIVTLPALPRLLVQCAAAAAVVVAMRGDSRIIEALPKTVEHVIVVLSIVWFINLVNFMDGIDWITAAEVLPVCGGVATIAAIGEAPAITRVVALAVGGGMLGFAPFNRPVARLFLGDVGSLPLGLLLAWMLVAVAGAGHVVAALLLPLYYLADSTITLVRRLLRGERVWEAHRTHYYQRATNHGWAVIDVVRHVFTVNLVLVVLALASVVVVATLAQVVCLVAGLVVVAWLLRRLVTPRA